MPYAQWHYPFENRDVFDERFPADFICEAVDQTRGWFYTLHALATLLHRTEDVPEGIAYRNADEIRGSFEKILEQLLASDTARVGIATHDPALVVHAEQMLERHAVPKERYEFQMLLGVAGPLRRRLLHHGHPLRVYVPFGELWFDYSLRRLRENPNIAGHIVRNLFASH